MWKRHIYHIILAIVVLAAFVLRTYNIRSIPPALTWDEVSIGYNAYSILKTGRDEHGRLFPLDVFVAYGDYKPPLAVYTTVPFVALFGLNELSVRLPSAVFGTLTVLLTYFLVLSLLGDNIGSKKAIHISILSAVILAISPWHINISRAGFEANTALFLVVSGIWLVMEARSKPLLWIFAWIPFVLSMYTFNSSRYFSVIIGMVLFVFVYKKIRKNISFFAIGIALAIVMLFPILPHLVSREARLRFAEVNIFTDISVVRTSNERIEREHGSALSKLLNNRRMGYARSYLLHFFDNLQPDFLFGKGDGNPKFSIQDTGQLYPFESVFFVIGVLWLLSAHSVAGVFLLSWIIAAIIPAAVARETPHALRILNSLPVWHIFIAAGIVVMADWFKKRSIGKVGFLFIVLSLYIFIVSYYLHNYYRHYPSEFSGEWQYGYKQALSKIDSVQNKYSTVIITESIGRAYMYTLFYEQIHPDELLKSIDAYTDSAGFYHVRGFTKYRFGGSLETVKPDTLYIWDAAAVPEGVRVIETIRLLNGNPVLKIFDDGGTNL